MSEYRITVVDEDFYEDNQSREIILKNVCLKLEPNKFVFVDLITGEEVNEYPRKRVLHLVKASDTETNPYILS